MKTWKKTILLLRYETAIIAIYHSRFYTDLYHSLEVKGHNFCPRPKKQDAPCALDTGQYFKKGQPKAYFFKAYSNVKNPKVASFLRAPEDLEGLRRLIFLFFKTHK